LIKVEESEEQVIDPQKHYFVPSLEDPTRPKSKSVLVVKTNFNKANIKRTPTIDRVLTEKMKNNAGNFDDLVDNDFLNNILKKK
jgi:hypothetical protein